MPSTSEKQRRFMGAELARKRSGKKTQTGMNETQLREFAGSVGSLEDIDFHENAATCDTVIDGTSTHPVHKGYDDVVFGNDRGWKEDGDEPKGSTMSANRDNGFGIHYGAEVDYFGPDTDHRAEEINFHQYGHDWEPAPFKDLFKTEDKAEERGIRDREEFDYAETNTPGYIPDKGLDSGLAYGAISYKDIPTDLPDRRSFKEQQRFRRATDKMDETDAVKVAKLDTKMGKNIR